MARAPAAAESSVPVVVVAYDGSPAAERALAYAAEREAAEELVRAVRAERVHEGSGAHVAVGARERAAVQVARAAREREGAVDDPDSCLHNERLRRLGLCE